MSIYAKVGMRGHNVAEWQRNLNKVRNTIGLTSPIVVDGIFGSGTLKATILAQRAIGVRPDGIVGDDTYKAFRKRFPHISTGFLAPTTSDVDKKYFDKSSKVRIDMWKTDPEKAKKIYISDTPPPIRKPIFRQSSIPELRKPVLKPKSKNNTVLLTSLAITAVAIMKFM